MPDALLANNSELVNKGSEEGFAVYRLSNGVHKLDARQTLKQRSRTAMLNGPIIPTMIRLALPTILVLLVQTLIGVAEAYYVGLLGTAALAGTAIVFPFWAMMAMMSNGGIGSGVSSAIARAIGNERHADADALVFHSLVLAIVLGLTSWMAAWWLGPLIYPLLGGHGSSLAIALRYSNFLFAASVPIWIVNLLASALRGAGNVKIPALVTLIGAGILLPASPALIFGFGPIPKFGIAGAGIAVGAYYSVAALVLLRYMASGRSGLTLKWMPIQWRYFSDILRVGLLVAASTVQTNLTVVVVTGAFGVFGFKTIAAYGIASRLDYFILPILFGLGTAVLTMVGMSAGAGDVVRAKHVAWSGALGGVALVGPLGMIAAWHPTVWLHLFSHEAEVVGPAAIYLHRVGMVYGLLGLGFVMSFASQGTGRVVWPFLAGTMRMLIAAGFGWIAVKYLGADIASLSLIVMASIVVYALLCIIPILRDDFGRLVRSS